MPHIVLKNDLLCTTFLLAQYVDFMADIKLAFREKKFVLREWSYDASKADKLEGLISKARDEVKKSEDTIARWCRVNFGDVYKVLLL